MKAESAAVPIHRDQDDIEDEISGWSDTDYVRMLARAKASAIGTDWQAEDILSEAIKLLYEGRRPWKHGVPFDAHMTMVMKGIGSNRRRSLCAKPTEPLEGEPQQDPAFALAEESAESSFHAKQLQNLINEVFKDDQTGWAVFMARCVEHMSIEDACQIAEVPRPQYETVMKRISRKLAKAIELGTIK
jgi:DNA-directed RNA polymerase specialized sigma24 family protein